MSITMDVAGITATYAAGAWSSTAPESDAITDMLNSMMAEQPGPSGADPYPALTRAREIADRLRGRITDEGSPPTAKRGVVY